MSKTIPVPGAGKDTRPVNKREGKMVLDKDFKGRRGGGHREWLPREAFLR